MLVVIVYSMVWYIYLINGIIWKFYDDVDCVYIIKFFNFWMEGVGKIEYGMRSFINNLID